MTGPLDELQRDTDVDPQFGISPTYPGTRAPSLTGRLRAGTFRSEGK